MYNLGISLIGLSYDIIENNRMTEGGEPQPFPHLADGLRFPRFGETIEVQISAIESAEV